MRLKLNPEIAVDKFYDQTYLLLENGKVAVLNEVASKILMEIITAGQCDSVENLMKRQYIVIEKDMSSILGDTEKLLGKLKDIGALIDE